MPSKEIRLQTVRQILDRLLPSEEEDAVFEKQAAEDHIRELIAAEHSPAAATPTEPQCAEKEEIGGFFDDMLPRRAAPPATPIIKATLHDAGRLKPVPYVEDAAPPATQTGDVRKGLTELREIVEQAIDGFVDGGNYVLTYSDIREQLVRLESLAASAAPTPEPTGADDDSIECPMCLRGRLLPPIDPDTEAAIQIITGDALTNREATKLDKFITALRLRRKRRKRALAAQPGQKGGSK
jgi:hypothetical protein